MRLREFQHLSNYLNQILVLFLASGGAFFLWFLLRTKTYNFPNADDFDIYLEFISRFQSEADLLARLNLIFQPHNEHYVVFNHLAALLSYYVRGQVDFSIITLAGLLQLPVIFCLFTKLRGKERPIDLVALALIFFSLGYVGALQWATTAWQNVLVFLFAFLAILLQKNDKPTALIFSSALAACFAQGNGVLIFFCLGLADVMKRRILYSLFWFFSGTTLLLALHSTSVKKTTFTLASVAEYFLVFIGSLLSAGLLELGLLFGAVILATLSIYILRISKHKEYALVAAIIFILSTALANSLARAEYGPLLPLETSRYRFVSMLAVCCSYICLAHFAQRLKSYIAGFGIVLGLLLQYAWTPNGLAELETRDTQLKDSAVRWQVSEGGLLHASPGHAKGILERAASSGVFKPPTIDLQSYMARDCELTVQRSSRIRQAGRVEHFIETDDYIIIDGWAFLWGNRSVTAFIGLYSDKKEAIFCPQARLRSDVESFHRLRFDQYGKLNSGYFFLIKKTAPLEELRDYRLVLKEQSGKTVIKEIPNTL